MKSIVSFYVKVLAFCLSAALLLSGCIDGLPEKPELQTSVSELLFSMSGGTQTITFETNRNWTASVDPTSVSADVSWCTVSGESGPMGTNTITVTVEGMEGDYREALLILNASAAGKEIRIRQSGIPLVSTGAAEEVNESGALLSVTWQYAGEISVSEVGVALRKTGIGGAFVDYAVETDEELVPGTYYVRVSDLNASTEYDAVAYVTTSEGDRYEGEQLNFTTAETPVKVAISEIKEMGRTVALGGSQTVADNLIIEGTVIASYTEPVEGTATTKSTSIEETKVLIVDGTGKDCGITLKLETGTNVYGRGDRISVRAKDGNLSHVASGAVYLAPSASGIELLSSGNEVVPVTVSHTALESYESMYVTIENTQLMSSFQGLETWSSRSVITFEVSGSETSFDAFVPATAEIASEAPSFLSGSLSGIVVSDDVSSYLVMATSREDVAGLTEDRFESVLTLRFLKPVFSGTLYTGEEIAGSVLRIEYRNGDGSTIENEIYADVSGDAAEGISVQPISGAVINPGTGYIDLVVEGTPTTEGEVIFTVYGIDGLEDPVCTAEVSQPYVPEVGNFETYWNISSHGYASSLPYTENTNPSGVSVSDMALIASADNMSGTKWSNDWGAIGWDSNTSVSSPSQYYTFALTVASGKTLDLSGLDLNFRINGGDIDLYVQYSIGSSAFNQAYYSKLTTSSSTSIVIGLGALADLTGISEGVTVTFRIVPVGTNSATKWALKTGDKSLSIYGNVD